MENITIALNDNIVYNTIIDGRNDILILMALNSENITDDIVLYSYEDYCMMHNYKLNKHVIYKAKGYDKGLSQEDGELILYGKVLVSLAVDLERMIDITKKRRFTNLFSDIIDFLTPSGTTTFGMCLRIVLVLSILNMIRLCICILMGIY